MTDKPNIFTEEERPAVCKGQLCPKCKNTDIEYVGCNPDGIHMNKAYDCRTCGAQWEGY